ncbi:MAG: hypothetical protein JXB20_05140 [Bacilli bacterium]|nr:hypothetical protein [Bacilli bacterium]MBN2696411.1 hypothetical protein [Bacilli bacterium]
MAFLEFQFGILLSKKTLTFLFLFTIFVSAAYLYSSNFYEGCGQLDANRDYYSSLYLDETVRIVKLVSICLGIFIFSQGYSFEANSATVFYLAQRHSRAMTLIARQTALVIIIGFFVWHHFLVFMLVENLLTPFAHHSADVAWIYLKIWIQAVFFGAIEGLVISIFQHYLTMLLPMSLYWFLETNSQSQSNLSAIVRTMNIYVPNLIKDNAGWDFTNGITTYLICFIALTTICYVIFEVSDI